jgi:hypothetical protein
MSEPNPICVALDTPDLDRARALAKKLRPHVGYLKIGMEFFYAHGAKGYEAVAAEGLPIFLDLKLHDIPNTVASDEALMQLTPSGHCEPPRLWRPGHDESGSRSRGRAGQTHCRDRVDQSLKR